MRCAWGGMGARNGGREFALFARFAVLDDQVTTKDAKGAKWEALSPIHGGAGRADGEGAGDLGTMEKGGKLLDLSLFP